VGDVKSNFNRCLDEVLKHEGGYVNHPRDPGGETNLGISRRSYPKEDIKGMTRERAAFLYRRDFWNAVRGDDLPAGLDLVAFDAAVNSGVSRGAKWLQQALGVEVDGKIGPATIEAAKKADAQATVNRALDIRLAFLRRLATWPTFGKGWGRRVEAVRSAALDMAATVPAQKPIGLLAALLGALARIFGK
jgi:lysozyme family protein